MSPVDGAGLKSGAARPVEHDSQSARVSVVLSRCRHDCGDGHADVDDLADGPVREHAAGVEVVSDGL